MKVIVYHHSRELADLKKLTGEAPDRNAGVYAKALAFGDLAAVEALWKARCYTPVAIYVHDLTGGESSLGSETLTKRDINQALEKAFEVTNTVDQPWYRVAERQSGLLVPLVPGARSSMVGDVFEVVHDDGTSKLFVCAMMGFKELRL